MKISSCFMIYFAFIYTVYIRLKCDGDWALKAICTFIRLYNQNTVTSSLIPLYIDYLYVAKLIFVSRILFAGILINCLCVVIGNHVLKSNSCVIFSNIFVGKHWCFKIKKKSRKKDEISRRYSVKKVRCLKAPSMFLLWALQESHRPQDLGAAKNKVGTPRSDGAGERRGGVRAEVATRCLEASRQEPWG